METNYNLFCNQLQEVLLEYPNLEIIEVNKRQYLKGIMDIGNDYGEICGSFLIEIHFSPLFPYRFPILFESGGDILNYADWHKYSDGSCCITVEADEIIKCKHGISLNEFIKKYCISFFANHIHKMITGVYKNGEYLHGSDGLKQFYEEFLLSTEIDIWLSYIKHVFIETVFPKARNKLCFCGRNIKYKNCHKKIFDEMLLIGHKNILNDLKQIYK